jgi:hypothetical protein
MAIVYWSINCTNKVTVSHPVFLFILRVLEWESGLYVFLSHFVNWVWAPVTWPTDVWILPRIISFLALSFFLYISHRTSSVSGDNSYLILAVKISKIVGLDRGVSLLSSDPQRRLCVNASNRPRPHTFQFILNDLTTLRRSANCAVW